MDEDAPDAGGFPPELRRRYQPRGRLGAGGMGVVYRVHDQELDRAAALKVLSAAAPPEARARFLREAAAMARLDHPHLIRLFDVGESSRGPYLVMELLEGRPLSDLAPGELEPAWVLELAAALEAMHAAGLLHRDVKLGNAFRTDDGRTVLLDLGLALAEDEERLTATGCVVGTLPYMAPELLQGEPPSPSSDWYALGVAWFEGLEGRWPFRREEILAVASGAPRPRVPWARVRDHALRRTVEALLAEDPIARPAGAAALEASLAVSPVGGAPSATPRPSSLRPAVLPPPTGPARHRAPAVVLLGVALVVAARALWPLPPAPPQPAPPATRAAPRPPPSPTPPVAVPDVAAVLGVLPAPAPSAAPEPVLPREARDWKTWADDGSADAAARLGEAYRTGSDGVPQDEARALEYLGLAASLGHGHGLLRLAEGYHRGELGLPGDPALAEELYRQALAAGNGWARLGLARLLEEGGTGDPAVVRRLREEAAAEQADPAMAAEARRQLARGPDATSPRPEAGARASVGSGP